jgi:hypothetical protein
MSDFKLVADSPYPIHLVKCCNWNRMYCYQNFPKYRYYGNNIKYMIDVATSGTRVKWKAHW